MNSTVKTIIFWVFVFACLVLLWQVFEKGTGSGKEQEITFSQFLQDAQQGQLSDVTVMGSEVRGHYKNDKSQFHVTVPANYPHLYDILSENKVSVTVKDQNGSSWLPIIINFAPIIIIGLLW
ncbi:MAG TPA: ATP-dependent metallopeptidase FtsH/Yme1/Tma family protein, partial [Pseudacidobacterium sp.]|nr:ATP-dependent metallopeptidase FtsH/Yme1/Tma family protein [Pseudacidobacterium sp.]